MVLYQGEDIPAEEVQALKEIGVEIPLKKVWGHYFNVGFKVEHGHITRLRIYHYLPKAEIPSSIAKLHHLKLLSLGGNRFRTVPNFIWALAQLEVLDLRENELTILPANLAKLTKLHTLALVNNSFRVFPEVITQLHSLEVLDLQHNSISILPDSISNLVNLTYINLEWNSLRTLPDSIGGLTHLKTLILNWNNIQTLPESFCNLSALAILLLHHNQLTTFPFNCSLLTSLGILDLSANQFSQFPASLGNLSGLTDLNLSRNMLVELPEEMGFLVHLRKLDLRENRISSFHLSCIRLTNLGNLRLADNNLHQLPTNLLRFQNLMSLDLANNHFNESIHEIIVRLNTFRQLRRLSFAHNELVNIPSFTNCLLKLEKLVLKNNKLTSIPESLFTLTSLRVLDIENNQIIFLPETISRLQLLRKLNITNNKLMNLPESSADLVNLTSLQASSNNIFNIPKSWPGHLEKLAFLNISHQKVHGNLEVLKELPALNELVLDGIDIPIFPSWNYGMCRLHKFSFRMNHLKRINNCIAEFRNLRVLDLSNNNLNTIPNLSKLQYLHTLTLNGNDFEEIFPGIESVSSLKKFNGNEISKTNSNLEEKRALLNLMIINIVKSIRTPQQIIQLFHLQGLITLDPKIAEIIRCLMTMTIQPKGLSELIINRVDLPITENLISSSPLETAPMSICERVVYLIFLAIDIIRKIDTDSRKITKIYVKNLSNFSVPVIDTIFQFLSYFPNLKSLFLQKCKLTSIPTILSSFDKLIELNLRDNLLEKLPDSFAGLVHLENLSLDDNKFEIIPLVLSQLPNLRYISLNGNPWAHFFLQYIINTNWESTKVNLVRLREFIPYLIRKIQNNIPLDTFDFAYPYYARYAELLQRICVAHNTATARDILQILSNSNSIPTKLNNLQIQL